MKRSIIPGCVTVAVLAFFYLPIAVVVVQSFNASRFGAAWGGFTLEWYDRLFSDRQVWSALRTSLLVAAASALLSAVLGTLSGYALYRWRSRMQGLHFSLVYLPLIMPDILLGLSLLLLFVNIGLPLGLVSIILAHTTFCISYVAFVVLARLEGFDYAGMEAALDLGASQRQAYLKILLPQLAPGIAAGALLSFTLSFDDFVITFFVSGPGSTTLPIYIYSMIRHGYPPIINALSTLLLLATAVLVVISQTLLRSGADGSDR